jgi:hypothetical protein
MLTTQELPVESRMIHQCSPRVKIVFLLTSLLACSHVEASVENGRTGFSFDPDLVGSPLCIVVPAEGTGAAGCDGVAPIYIDMLRAAEPMAAPSGGVFPLGLALGVGDQTAIFFVLAFPYSEGPLRLETARVILDGYIEGQGEQISTDITDPLTMEERALGPVGRVRMRASQGQVVQDKALFIFSGGEWVFLAEISTINGDLEPFLQIADRIVSAISVPPPVARPERRNIAYEVGRLFGYLFLGVLLIYGALKLFRRTKPAA